MKRSGGGSDKGQRKRLDCKVDQAKPCISHRGALVHSLLIRIASRQAEVHQAFVFLPSSATEFGYCWRDKALKE